LRAISEDQGELVFCSFAQRKGNGEKVKMAGNGYYTNVQHFPCQSVKTADLHEGGEVAANGVQIFIIFPAKMAVGPSKVVGG
jgi:hypothetical protein